METANSSPPAEIPRMAVQLPPFWAKRPAVWFAQAESQFTLAGISSEKKKFCCVISQLDHWYAMEVEDITLGSSTWLSLHATRTDISQPHRRHGHQWADNIKMDIQGIWCEREDYTELIWDRIQCRSFTNTVPLDSVRTESS